MGSTTTASNTRKRRQPSRESSQHFETDYESDNMGNCSSNQTRYDSCHARGVKRVKAGHGSHAERPSHMVLVDRQGSLFDASPQAVLVHSCNCKGTWGGGIARAFKARYPGAFAIYYQHCRDTPNSQLLGTALLIPPQKGDAGSDWVGCLFTRADPGFPKGLSKRQEEAEVQSTVRLTKQAFEALLREVASRERDGEWLGDVCMPQLNAGLFRVPWRFTAEALESCGGDGVRKKSYVYTPAPREAGPARRRK